MLAVSLVSAALCRLYHLCSMRRWRVRGCRRFAEPNTLKCAPATLANVAGLAGCCLLAKHIKHTRAEKADAAGPRRHMHACKLCTMFLRGRVHRMLAVRRRPVLQPTRWSIMIFADSRRLLPSLCASQNQSPFSIQLTLSSPPNDQRRLNEHSGHGRRRGRLHRGV